MLKFIKNLKSAMTLGELLIVFLIMGVIAAMSMITVKPNEKSLKYIYYRMYNALGTAFYNTSLDLDDDLLNDSAMDKLFPTTSELFCKMLMEYINTKDSDTTACANTTINVDSPDFTKDPHFIASNGVKVWIGHSKSGSAGSYSTYTGTDAAGDELSIRYYWVFVDLNGDMGPNSTENTNKRMADIVGFIVTEDYEVIPVGQPEIDTRYFSAAVVYFATSEAADEEQYDTSVQMSYLEAKRHAWGLSGKQFYVSESEPMSINFYDDTNITSASPFYLNYDSSDTEISDIMAETADTECLDDDGTVDPEACYISINDYY